MGTVKDHMKLTDEDYRSVAAQLARRLTGARDQGLKFPVEVCVTGMNNDIVLHCSVGEDGKLGGLVEWALGACWSLIATITDQNGNVLDITMNADDSID
jgi:hypothetical protein